MVGGEANKNFFKLIISLLWRLLKWHFTVALW